MQQTINCLDGKIGKIGLNAPWLVAMKDSKEE